MKRRCYINVCSFYIAQFAYSSSLEDTPIDLNLADWQTHTVFLVPLTRAAHSCIVFRVVFHVIAFNVMRLILSLLVTEQASEKSVDIAISKANKNCPLIEGENKLVTRGQFFRFHTKPCRLQLLSENRTKWSIVCQAVYETVYCSVCPFSLLKAAVRVPRKRCDHLGSLIIISLVFFLDSAAHVSCLFPARVHQSPERIALSNIYSREKKHK